MIEIRTDKNWGIMCIHISGRMDSMTSNEIERQFDELVLMGERKILVDLSGIAYVSSAGLRVFMTAHRQLDKADGELMFFKPSGNVLDVFRLSGFDNFFKIINSEEELLSLASTDKGLAEIETRELEGISFQYSQISAPMGKLLEIGSQAALSFSDYAEQDVVPVNASQVQFATGLAAMGDNYEEYKNYFGEAVVLNHSLFFYPAVKRPAVDFFLCRQNNNDLVYPFFHGFGFSGSFSTVLSFETSQDFVSLSALSKHLFEFSEAKILGVVLLAESKGLWGMNLRQVPISENKPQNGLPIFDAKNFPAWMNFPVEPSDINHVVAGVGICVKDAGQISSSLQSVLGKDQTSHFHGGIFGKEPLSKEITRFEDELNRVLHEMEVSKVQHILGQTVFNSGLIGLIELE